MDEDEVRPWLPKKGTKTTVLGMARYGIEAKHAFGFVLMACLAGHRLSPIRASGNGNTLQREAPCLNC